ncbi:MAG: hypothetical protein IAF08_12520 [Rhizobacter sp.]|nr:hypothetical protein [Chlorobiales bacterium]
MKKRYRVIFLAFAAIALLPASLLAQSPYTAGSRLYRTQEAYLARKGTFSFAVTGSYFSKGNDFLLPNDYSNLSAGFTPAALNQNNLDMMIDYVASKRFTFSFGANIFQDRHSIAPLASARTNTFGGLTLNFKLGSLPLGSENVQGGAMLNVYAPFTREGNIPFVPYRSNSFEIGVHFLTSIYTDGLFPDRSLGFHINVGLHNYLNTERDVSRSLDNTYLISNRTVGLRTALGVKYPTTYVDFFAEASGEFFIGSRPPTPVYGREDYVYAGIGARGRPLEWLSVELVGEFLVLGATNTTNYESGAQYNIIDLSASNLNYVPFKISGGVRMDISRRFSIFTNTENYSDQNDPAKQFSPDERRRNKRILDVLDERTDDLNEIYRDARRLDESLEGKVYFELLIGKDGSTKRARVLVSTFNETPIASQTERLMTEKVQTWRYPAGENDLVLEILRLDFSARGVTPVTSN